MQLRIVAANPESLNDSLWRTFTPVQLVEDDRMEYRLEYMRQIKRLGTVAASVTLDAAMKAASEGMADISADFVRLVEEDTGLEVASYRLDN